MNPTRNHEVARSIPGLTQWVKDPALLWAMGYVTDAPVICFAVAKANSYSSDWTPSLGTFISRRCSPKKKNKLIHNKKLSERKLTQNNTYGVIPFVAVSDAVLWIYHNLLVHSTAVDSWVLLVSGHYNSTDMNILLFLATTAACGSSQATYQTHTIAVARTIAVIMLDP